ncbi:hypothetical protein [Streptomyces sp. 11x1]|uniref:hypothetical protein n=1 Tax=Streptomyces sp. 11x1 TaxID=3038642 RepID=UPI0037DA37FC
MWRRGKAERTGCDGEAGLRRGLYAERVRRLGLSEPEALAAARDALRAAYVE